MLGLPLGRVLLAALLLAGCGVDAPPPVAVTRAALSSCNVAADCPAATVGTCVERVCNPDHTCGFAMDNAACPTGCAVALTDCALPCYVPPCNSGVCDFSDYSSALGCQCTGDSDCTTMPSTCQNAPTCQFGVCAYTAKTGGGGALLAGCCNADSDCNSGATCTQATNACACAGGKHYCATGPAGCVTGTECCADADCGGTATCVDGSCACAATEKFCPGATTGSGVCVPSTGCCQDSDCAPRANASVACTSHTCNYTCNSGFHDCTGTCKSDTSVQSCGMLCTPCPTGNACQTPACTAGACGLVAAGGSPCCNAPGDCVVMNACQQVTGCSNNECQFGAKPGVSGCCDAADQCPPSSDPCLAPSCVANQCAYAPIPGCSDDGGTPAPPDLSAAVDLGRAEDLGVPDLAAPVPPPDLAVPAPLSLTGGGGCDLGAGAPAAAVPFVLLLVALTLVSRRRRS